MEFSYERSSGTKEEWPIFWHSLFEEAQSDLNFAFSKMGDSFYPQEHRLYRAFELCPPSLVKVVIFGQDPYHSLENGSCQASGLAFSIDKGKKIQPSLRNIYAELSRSIPDFVIPKHGDLSSWALQGVLLLNTSLTVEPSKAASHRGYWNGFIARCIEFISKKNPDCVYVLWGKDAHDLQSIIGQSGTILKSSHPSPLSFKRGGKGYPSFYESDHFNKINEILIKTRQEPIDWNSVSRDT